MSQTEEPMEVADVGDNSVRIGPIQKAISSL